MGNWTNLTADDGHSFSAYHAKPKSENAKGLGIVIVQEIFGVNSHIRSVCDRYAEEGYEVVAPALFDRVEKGVELGYESEDWVKADEVTNQLKPRTVLTDLQTSINFLKQNVPGKIGMIGYCYGGTMTWLAAGKLDNMSAAICYYGHVFYVPEAPKSCPVQMHFGAEDKLIPLEQVTKFKEEHELVDLYTYPAGHGFNCDARKEFDQAAADLANKRSLEFLAECLA